jgi:hypothetical protein
VPSAVVAAWLFEVFPAYLTSEKATLYSYVAFGFAAIFTAANSQGGIERWVRSVAVRYREPRLSSASGVHRPGTDRADSEPAAPEPSADSEVDGPSEDLNREEATAGTAANALRSASNRHDEGV